MIRRVSYSPAARQHLTEVFRWIADASGFPDRAESFVVSILDFCDELGEMPLVGTARDDLRPGLRVIGFRRRAVVAFAVHDATVEILGVYYGGRDYESIIVEHH